jgi:DNA (cytosine-5)-methyltransferase 1
VPLDDVLAPCYALHHNLIFDMNLWTVLGAEYFYYRYRFTRRHPASWDEREPVKEDAIVGCETCAYALQVRLAEAVEFAEEAQKHKLRAFDVFAGAGAMSLGMEGSTGMKTTHAVEISPSAARTFRYPREGSPRDVFGGIIRSHGSNNSFIFSRRNSPKTIVYNQCVNELLRYAVKSHHGILEEEGVPKDLYDNSRLPPPPQPGDIDVITAGFPWCVYTLRIMQTDKTRGTCQPASLPAEHVSEGKRYQEQFDSEPPLLG